MTYTTVHDAIKVCNDNLTCVNSSNSLHTYWTYIKEGLQRLQPFDEYDPIMETMVKEAAYDRLFPKSVLNK